MLKLLLRAWASRPTALATAIAAGLVTQSLSAQAQRGTIPLVITENSGSDFTATYNGSPLSPSFEGQEQASFPLPAGTLLHDISELNGGPFGGNVGFTEPDNPGLFNLIFTGEDVANGGPGVFIHSDESVAFFENFSGLPLTLFSDGSSMLIGVDNNENNIVLTVHDNAGAVETPDTGSTLNLLALALVALLGSTCLRCLRLVITSLNKLAATN